MTNDATKLLIDVLKEIRDKAGNAVAAFENGDYSGSGPHDSGWTTDVDYEE